VSPQFAFCKVLVDFFQMASIVVSNEDAQRLHLHLLAFDLSTVGMFSGDGFPCIAPLSPIASVAVAGMLPVFLFLQMAVMFIAQSVYIRYRYLRSALEERTAMHGMLKLRYLHGCWRLLLQSFSCECAACLVSVLNVTTSPSCRCAPTVFVPWGCLPRRLV
jgi:hypothetical protein